MNNPPAFPFPAYTYPNGEFNQGEDGITMRDYFAARAMEALLSDPDWRQDMDIKDTALAAYKTADAMMKAREA